MRIGGLVAPPAEAVESVASVASVERRLLTERVLVVTEKGRFIGLLSAADVLRRPHRLVGDCLSPLPPVDCDTPVEDVLTLMEERSVHFVPVFREGAFHGIAAYKSILDYLSRTHAEVVERYQKQAEKLESLRTMAGGVAHDFSNLLCGVAGWLDLVLKDHAISSVSRDRLEKARDAAAHASQLTEQLLQYSRDGSLSRSRIQLEGFIRHNAALVVFGGNVRVVYEIAEDVCDVTANAERLAQAIHNLMLNAVQALGTEGGRVNISARNLRVSASDRLPLDPGEYVEIAVADTGPGIEPELRSRLFEPYFTTKPGGSGLGLAIVQSVITGHGGCVEVESAPGEGTTFRMLLPAARAGEEPPAAEAS